MQNVPTTHIYLFVLIWFLLKAKVYVIIIIEHVIRPYNKKKKSNEINKTISLIIPNI